MVNRIIPVNRNRTYYRPCPRCGANLDPGEKCDCERGAAMVIPFDKERLEKTLQALDTLWAKAPELDRDAIERQLIGGTILGVYPLIGISGDGSTYLSGLSLAIKTLESRKVITLDIDTMLGGSHEADTGVNIEDCYVEPEETAFI